MSASNNVLLTGLPRSGTTLVCHLLSQTDDAVALHEPMQVGQWAKLAGIDEIFAEIDGFFAANRKSLLEERSASSKNFEGRVPDNPIASQYSDHGLRKSVASRGQIQVDKPLTPDFLLAVKHNAAFTALLEPLVARYRCFAIVRNPLSVLASWQSVDIPVNKGHVPAAERLDPALRAALADIPEAVDRQFYILDWFFAKFARHVPRDRTLFYEELIATGGRSLSVVTPAADLLKEPLSSRNKNALYRQDLYAQLGRRLLDSPGAYWDYYSKASVEALLQGN
jgi:hypothetical protein